MERMDKYHRSADSTVKTVSAAYDKAQKDLQLEIDKIFEVFGANGQITPEKARKILNQKVPNPLLNLAKIIYPKIKDPRIKRWMLTRMNAPAYRARITRLEALKETIFLQSKAIADAEIQASTVGYMKTINDAYYRTMFDIQRGLGVGFEFAVMPSSTVESILKNPWSGEHFSQRVWGNTDVLASQITEVITAGFMAGTGTVKMARELAERMNVGKHAANRLIRTETTYMANAAEMESYVEAEIDEYMFRAVLDKRTSTICQKQDGKVHKVKNAKAGVNMPPMHVFCRSTTRAYFGPKTLEGVQRRARDPVTGKTELIPASMNYEQWYKEKVEKHGEQKLTAEQKKLKNKASDKLQYEKIKATIGRQGPKSLSAFQEMKYNNEKEYGLLKDYTKSRESNMISAHTSFDGYLAYKDRIEKELVGITTKGGTVIKSQSKHFIERVFGTSEDPLTKRSRNGVSLEEIKGALLNGEVKINKRASNSIKYLGATCEVSVNPETGNLIQVNPISSRRGTGETKKR